MSDERIGIAVIGAGHWGPNLIRNFQDLHESTVHWVVDINPDRLSQVKERYPGVKVDTDPDVALADSSVDAVVIATPTSTHYPLVKRSLQQGKHVMVEKPIAAESGQGEELAALTNETGLVVLVGHVFLYNRAVQKVKEYIDSNDLGTIHYIAMVRTNLGPIRLDVNAAWDLASHDISISDYWLGASPISAWAVGGSWINPGIEDAVFATLRYPEQVLVNLHLSWLNPRKTRDITVVGDRRMLTLDDLSLTEPIRMYDKGVADEWTTPAFVDTFASFRASVREGDITIPKVPLGEPLKTECQDFLECVLHGKRPLSGAEEGLSVVRTLEAIRRSLQREGQRVDLSDLS